jgi:RNA polymerase sigma-70 factor (ECF subfamily)
MIVETDANLVRRTLDGDSSAFGRLLFRYQDTMHRLALRMTGNEEDARDIVQDSSLLGYCGLGRLQRTDRFFSWLYQITQRTTVTALRRRRPLLSTEALFTERRQEPVDRHPRPEEVAQRNEWQRRLSESLGRLCPQYREVVELQLQGHSYPNIADLLSLPLGTVRSRLHRARAQLREELADGVRTPHRRPLPGPAVMEEVQCTCLG